jgi:hypothetical protein
MASDQNQLNYWFGSAAPEMRVTMAGGGPGRIPADQMLENMRTPAAANDPGMVNMPRAANYEAAIRQQQIMQAAKQGAHIGDVNYWQKIADQEGHKIGGYTNPYKAAKETSRNGQDTIIIDPDGRRVLYRNGQRLVERYSDMPK